MSVENSVSCTNTNRLIRFAHNYMRVHNDRRTLGEVFAEKENRKEKQMNKRIMGVKEMLEMSPSNVKTAICLPSKWSLLLGTVTIGLPTKVPPLGPMKK